MPTRLQGLSTGAMTVKVLDDLAVLDGASTTSSSAMNLRVLVYDVETVNPFTESVVAKDTVFVPLDQDKHHRSIVQSGGCHRAPRWIPSRYLLDGPQGRIRGVAPGNLQDGIAYTARYRYNPVYASNSLANEDDNPVFDGMRLYVMDVPLGIDSLGTAGGQQASNLLRSCPEDHGASERTVSARPASI